MSNPTFKITPAYVLYVDTMSAQSAGHTYTKYVRHPLANVLPEPRRVPEQLPQELVRAGALRRPVRDGRALVEVLPERPPVPPPALPVRHEAKVEARARSGAEVSAQLSVGKGLGGARTRGGSSTHSSIMGLCVRSDVLAAFFSRSSCTARALSRTRMDWPMTLK